MSGIKYYAIIVAGGSGSRMQSEIPKQFLILNRRPVLMHTMEAFQSSSYAPIIILVLHRDYHAYWLQLCKEHNYTFPHILIEGGDHRFNSVRAGLKTVENGSIVSIHDAVRPCITSFVIDSAYAQAKTLGNAVVAVKSCDSIRQNIGTKTVSLKRDDIYLVQTPQVFKSEEIKNAYEQEFRADFTDDASVLESSGGEIFLIEGDRKNVKITFPEDLRVAEAYLKEK